MRVRKAATVVIAGVFGALFHAGCGGASVDSVCQLSCDCMGCSPKELQDCETQGSQEQQVAEQLGCGGEFDDEVACFSGLTCKNHQLDDAACQHQIQAVQTCADKKVGGASGPPPG